MSHHAPQSHWSLYPFVSAPYSCSVPTKGELKKNKTISNTKEQKEKKKKERKQRSKWKTLHSCVSQLSVGSPFNFTALGDAAHHFVQPALLANVHCIIMNCWSGSKSLASDTASIQTFTETPFGYSAVAPVMEILRLWFCRINPFIYPNRSYMGRCWDVATPSPRYVPGCQLI